MTLEKISEQNLVADYHLHEHWKLFLELLRERKRCVNKECSPMLSNVGENRQHP